MAKRKPAIGNDEEPLLTTKKPRSGGKLSFTVDEASAICQTAHETAVEAKVMRQVFRILTGSIKTRTAPTESDAALLGALAQMLKSSSASIKGLQDTQPTSLASLDAAAGRLLGKLGNLLKQQAGRPLVESMLAIAQRHIPCQPASEQHAVYAHALAALARAATFLDEAHMTTQEVALAIVAALDQRFDAAAHASVVDLLDTLGMECGEAWVQVLIQSGSITSLCRLICSVEAGNMPRNSGSALGNYVQAASPQQVQQILHLVGKDLIAFQVAPALTRRASLCKPDGCDVWALHMLVHKELLSKHACVQAGAIPAALANLRQRRSAPYAAGLLRYVVDGPDAAASLLASDGIQHIALALASADAIATLLLLPVLLYLVSNESSSYPATLQCLRHGMLWRVQRKCKQLEKEAANAGDDDQKKVAIGFVSKAASGFAELLCTKVTAELECVALFPITERHAVWVGCFLAEHAADERLKTLMLDWGLLQRLCKELAAATPPQQALPAEAASQADDPERTRAVAGGLMALLNRLKPASHTANATTSMNQSLEASPGPVGVDAILRVPISNSVFMGVHRWQEVKLRVEGREFYVLKDSLLHASPAFRAMLEGGFSEQGAPEIAIPNVTFDAWTVVMRFVCTGHAVVPPELAQQVLLIANQYLLDGLKGLCQEVLIAHLTPANLPDMFALAGDVSADLLQRACITAALEHWEAGATFRQEHPGGPAGCWPPALQPEACGSFSQALAAGPAGGPSAAALQPEQQAASMASDNPPPHLRCQAPPADHADNEAAGQPCGSRADMQMATDAQSGLAGPPASERQGAAAQQPLGPSPSGDPAPCDQPQGAEQHMTTAFAATATLPQAISSSQSMPPIHAVPAAATIQQLCDVDQQLRQQVAAVLLPLLEQLIEGVLPMVAGVA